MSNIVPLRHNHELEHERYVGAATQAARPLFEQLSETPPDADVPWLDRHADIDEAALTDAQSEWRRNGVVLRKGFVPKALTQAYARARAHLGLRGYPDIFAYMRVAELRAIACYKPLSDLLSEILGEEMLPHFDLTQWTSTERTWHQDDYLNDPWVNGHYAAVWFAIDHIHPDCGPFQYAPGTNRWPVVRRERVMERLTEDERDPALWPRLSERLVGPAYETELSRRNAKIETFIGAPGDALIWHARLVHRGSSPKTPGMVRKSLIVHYTGMSRLQPQLHEVRRTPDGAPYIWHLNAPKDFP